jgi:hypothetical protein
MNKIYYMGHELIMDETGFFMKINKNGLEEIVRHYYCNKCGLYNFIDLKNNERILTCNERIIKGIIE